MEKQNMLPKPTLLILLVFLLIFFLMITACAPQATTELEKNQKIEVASGENQETNAETESHSDSQEVDNPDETESDGNILNFPLWQTVTLEDVITGDKFTINDFKDQVVVIESFAVWCPICLKQQQEMAKVDNGVHIALNTDPNEDADKVREHVETHGFDWKYAIAPEEMTQSLIDEFGIGVVNAPSAPVIIMCGDGSSRLLGRGIKSAEQLESEIKRC